MNKTKSIYAKLRKSFLNLPIVRFFVREYWLSVLHRWSEAADRKHAETGDRFFVLGDMVGKLRVVNRKTFRILKQRGYIGRNIFVNDLCRESFYQTPCRGENHKLPKQVIKKKEREFLRWKGLV